MKIYFSEDSDLLEEEMIEKERRGDVIVEKDGCFYSMAFMTEQRIAAEHRHMKKLGFAYVVWGSVIVDSVDKKTIISNIRNIIRDDELKWFDLVDFSKYEKSFPELAHIENWQLIYEED